MDDKCIMENLLLTTKGVCDLYMHSTKMCIRDRYCYANLSQRQVEENRRQHNPDSPLLIGSLRGDEKITPRVMRSVIKKT